MKYSVAGRVAFIAQWIAPVLVISFLFWGRGLLGAELGWLAVGGFIFGIPMMLLLYIAPVLTVFDRDVRPVASTRRSFATVSWMLWGALVLLGLTVLDQADGPTSSSAISLLTDGGISDEMSSFISVLAAVFAFIMWAATIALAILGIVRSRRPDGMPAPRVGAEPSSGAVR